MPSLNLKRYFYLNHILLHGKHSCSYYKNNTWYSVACNTIFSFCVYFVSGSIIPEQADVVSSQRGSSESLWRHQQQLSVQRLHKFSNLILFNFSIGLTLIRGSYKTVFLLCLDYIKVFLVCLLAPGATASKLIATRL